MLLSLTCHWTFSGSCYKVSIPKLHIVLLLKCCALFPRNSRLIAQKPLSWMKLQHHCLTLLWTKVFRCLEGEITSCLISTSNSTSQAWGAGRLSTAKRIEHCFFQQFPWSCPCWLLYQQFSRILGFCFFGVRLFWEGLPTEILQMISAQETRIFFLPHFTHT